jgi:hypothetical protein
MAEDSFVNADGAEELRLDNVFGPEAADKFIPFKVEKKVGATVLPRRRVVEVVPVVGVVFKVEVLG